MKCSNCDGEIKNSQKAIKVTQGPGVVTAEICEKCQKDVKVLKIVLKREAPKDEFNFEQLLPVETFK